MFCGEHVFWWKLSVEYLTVLVYLFLRGIFKSSIICISHFFLFLPLSSELRDDQCDPFRGNPEGNNNETTNHSLNPSCILFLHTFYVLFILVFFNNEMSMVWLAHYFLDSRLWICTLTLILLFFLFVDAGFVALRVSSFIGCWYDIWQALDGKIWTTMPCKQHS
jgi:hypothetical protein